MGSSDKSEAINPPVPYGVSNKEKSTATNDHSSCYETIDPETLFDSLNQTYSDAYEKNAAQVQCIQKLLSMLSPGSQVLDIGSGTGFPAASMLTNAGMNVTGIDKSSTMINVARVNVPSAKFHRCDMRQFRPPNDKKYDAIVAIFSILMVSTSTIREMAFKMAHWLKPGGLLVLGIIDWTDVNQADGWPADPYGEWLNHHFMGQVIKDNLFRVGEWISLLRSVDIALVDVQGAVFEAEDSGILTEPECFFVGRKGDKEALMGPFRTPTNIEMGLSPDVLTDIEQQLVADRDELTRLLDGLPDAVDITKSNTNNSERYALPEVEADAAQNKSGPDSLTQPFDTDETSISHHMQHNPGSSIIIILPSPFNDFVTILNNVASFFNLSTIHAGAGLQAAVTQSRSKGYTNLQTSLLGNEYLDFSSSKTIIEDATKLSMQAFTAHQNKPLRQAVKLALSAQLERYFANQKSFGGREDRIGFQRVVLIARRDEGLGTQATIV